MQIIGLILFRGDTFKHEGNQRDIVSFNQLGIEDTELPCVIKPVVRRQLDAKQQHSGVRPLCLFDDPAQIPFRFGHGCATQPIVRAQLDYDDGGLVLLQCLGYATQATGSRLAADAGIYYCELGMVFFQFLLQ